MESPLQLLREMFPFVPLSAEQKSAAAVRGMLDTVSGLSPHETVAKLASQVLPTANQQANLHMRFKLLEDIRAEAEQALPTLEAEIMGAVLPLPIAAATAALQADNLLKGLAMAFGRVAHGIQQHPQHGSWQPLCYRSIQRAMSMVARRQLMAYRAYAVPSPGSWQMLHELYQMGCARSAPLNGETARIENEYLGALLFAYLEPGKLPRSELETVYRCARQLAAYATIGTATPESGFSRSAESCFVVRPDEGTPGYPMMRLPAGTSIFGSLLIDGTQVLAALDRNITRRAGKTIEPDLDAAPALLQSLRVAIGGKSARRHPRTRFRPRADLIAGLSQVIHFLDGHTYTRRAVDVVGSHPGLDIQSGEWSLVDESPDGFKLRYIKGEKSVLGSGDVVALMPRESSKIHVCLVRRISAAQGRLEIGLQLMSPQVSVVDVRAEDGPEQRAIFLHNLPAYGRFAGLIAPPGTGRPGQPISIQLPGRALNKKIGTCMEANDGLEFFALDPLPD